MDPDLDEMFIKLCELYRIYKKYNIVKTYTRKHTRRKYIERPSAGGMGADQLFQRARMSHTAFEILLKLTGKHLRKPKQRIDAEERLSITLLYLSQGLSMVSIANMYKVVKKTIRTIVLETCEIIWRILSPTYVSQPTVSHYQHIAKDFMELWHIPNCVGAIAGKRVAIKFPADIESMDNKKAFSIVLMAACDAKYNFTAISIGSYSSQSDEGIFQLSSFGQALMQNTLPLPPHVPLCKDLPPSLTTPFPHYFVGDSTFPLRPNLMRPYHGAEMTKTKEIFNYRLSLAHKVVENSFGILMARWRVLNTTIEGNPKSSEKIVLACIALHNFIKANDPDGLYCPKNYVDRVERGRIVHSGDWRREVGNTNVRSLPSVRPVVCREAFQLRETLANYFERDGALPYQEKRIEFLKA